MIDIENIVFDKIQSLILAEYPSAQVESTYITRAASLPCVCLFESDNSVYERTQDLSSRENHASVYYECDIYTSGDSRKSQAKAIRDIIDNAMLEMGFTRTYQGQTPNVTRTIFRYTMRYSGVVSKGIEKGDDTVFYIFKN